eukprot:sb/3476293/
MVYSEEASFLELINEVLSCLHFQGGYHKVPRDLSKLDKFGNLSFLGRERKTLKSGCLSLLTIRSFGARDGLGLTVRVWLGELTKQGKNTRKGTRTHCYNCYTQGRQVSTLLTLKRRER